MTTPLSPTLTRAPALVAAERHRQDRKWGRGDSFRGGLGFGPAATDTLRSMLTTITRDHLASGDVERAAKAICDEAAAAGNADAAKVMLEELAEVLHALVGERDPARVRDELVQLTAVACKILEALDPLRDDLATRKLRVYVAGPMGEAHVARLIGDLLTREGFDVVSRWTDRLAAQPEHPTDDALDAIQVGNQAELCAADLVVAWTAAGRPKATYAEIGWALAQGTRVLWIQGADGTGGSLFDRERLVTVVKVNVATDAQTQGRRVLAAVRILDATIRASRAGIAPLPLDGMNAPRTSPADMPASLLLAVHAACAAVEQASLIAIERAVTATPEHATVTTRAILDAIHVLDTLGAIDLGDPGGEGEARWTPLGVQRSIALLRKSNLTLARENEALRDALAAKGAR